MINIGSLLLDLLRGGFDNLAAYLAAHVLLCLLPAFAIAGAMTALIPKELVTRYLGRTTPRYISYPAAAAAGFLLAVCSCTVMPLFAGIYKKGAGLGPAITFLFIAPAINILALIYTGGVIGADLALARLALSLLFGIGIGLVMALIFRQEDVQHDRATDALFGSQARMRRVVALFLLTLVALLVVGTFQIRPLTQTLAEIHLSLAGVDRLQAWLNALVPFDATRGEEGVTVQGALLIGLLVIMAATAWRGLERIHDGFNTWTWTTAGLLGVTLVVAALRLTPTAEGVTLTLTGKTLGVAVTILLSGWLLKARLTEDEARDFLWESWRFVRQIFPLLVVGVFAVGMIRQLIRPEWIEAIAGRNTWTANLVGVLFGVFMYFPTLVEVPIAQMFLSLGMHRGPLLAYLMADPELSLQSILVTASIIGRTKAWVYVGLVALFSLLAGLLYGAWIDGAGVGQLALYLGACLATLGVIIWRLGRRAAAATALAH